MLARRLAGATTNEIATEFHCSDRTVRRCLGEAREGGLLDRVRDYVAGTLIPKALRVYEQRLEEGDLSAARDILFGTGLLRKNIKIEETVQPSAADVELDVIRARIRASRDVH